MRKMRDSGNMWIGATPETWKMIPLKYLASYNDEVLSENTDDEFEFDYIEIGSVQYGRGIIYTEHMKFKNAPSRARRIVRKDDIIVSTVRTYLKAVATIPACNNSLIASTGFIVIRPHKVLPRFMNYALLSESFISLVESHSTGISYPAINSVDVVKFKIPVPCRSEQERIAAFLDAECAEIDAVLEKTRASIEEYKKLKQAVITQAVTKGIREDRPMKDSGIEWIGEIPEEWDCKKVKYVTSISRGIFNHRPRNDERCYGGEYPFIQTGDVAGAQKYIESYSQTLNELGKSVSKCFPKGTLTMTIAANVGDAAILGFDAFFPDSVVGFIPNADINDEYLYYIFKAMKPEFVRTAIKSTQFNLNVERIRDLFVPVVVQKSEQLEIAEYLNTKCADIDALIAKKQQYLTEIENYKKSLIYEYVTGKKEVHPL